MVLDDVQRLEECCLSTILDNFDLFMMDYRSAEPRFSKLYEFLQRAYSDTLMAKLVEKNKLQDDHLYFVINPYIRKLHFKKSTVNPQIVIERLKVFGSAVTSLNLSSAKWTRRTIKQLVPLMPMLRALDLSNGKCSDEVLKQVVRYCPHLEVLDVTHSPGVTIEGLKYFCTDENGCIENTTLKELRIFQTQVNSAELESILDRFLSLTILDHLGLADIICFRHMTDFLSNAIDSLPQYNLTALTLPFITDYRPSDVLNLCAVVCPNINVLKVVYIRTEKDVTACTRFKNVTDFEVLGVTPPSDNLTYFIESRGYNLQQYRQHDGKISVAKLCECCPKLEELLLFNVEFENAMKWNEDINIYSLPKLVKLHVHNATFLKPSVADSVIFLVMSCPNLEILDLNHNDDFTESLINSITQSHCFMTTLRKFDVSYSSSFSAHLARKILQCKSRLKTLVVTCTGITAEEYNELNNLRNVNVNRGVNIIWKRERIDYDYYDESG